MQLLNTVIQRNSFQEKFSTNFLVINAPLILQNFPFRNEFWCYLISTALVSKKNQCTWCSPNDNNKRSVRHLSDNNRNGSSMDLAGDGLRRLDTRSDHQHNSIRLTFYNWGSVYFNWFLTNTQSRFASVSILLNTRWGWEFLNRGGLTKTKRKKIFIDGLTQWRSDKWPQLYQMH